LEDDIGMTIRDLTSLSTEDYAEYGLPQAKLRWILRKMIEIRRFEEKAEELYLLKGQITGPLHLYLGQEAVAAGVTAALQKDDLVITTYRGHGHAIAKDVSLNPLMAELFGKSTGTCKGLSGSMHAAIDRQHGVLVATAIVGGGIPIATGVGLGLKHKERDSLAAVFFGDGAVNIGSFHEGLNMTAVWKLPVLFVCENNNYAMSTRVDEAVSTESIAERGASYGMRAFVADGNDARSVYAAATEAVNLIRAGEGPVFLECRTYKMKGHGVYDKAEYRPEEEAERWLERDPIDLLESEMRAQGLIEGEEVRRMKEKIDAAVEEAVDFAVESDVLPFEELMKYVYV
jgi:pyruvate dehydrogenase E1 component alpha subunit